MTYHVDAGGGGGGGVGTPVAPDRSVQFNDAGAFGGAASVTIIDGNASDGFLLVGNGSQNVNILALITADQVFPNPTTAGTRIAISATLQTTGVSTEVGSSNYTVFDFDLFNEATGTKASALFGIRGLVGNYSSVGVFTNMIGYYMYMENTAGAVPDMAAYQSLIVVSGGTVTTAYGMQMIAPQRSGAGVITNNYGLKIEDFASITGTTINRPIDYGSGKFVVNADGSIDIATDGVRLSAADGVFTILGRGNGNDETLTFDFDNATANIVAVSTTTGVVAMTFFGGATVGAGGMEVINTGVYGFSSTASPIGAIDTAISRSSAGIAEVTSGASGTYRDLILRNLYIAGAQGVQVSAAAGVLTLAGIGNTHNENLTISFESAANTIALASGTGVTSITFAMAITHASATLLTTTVALTNGAAASLGTLTNAPAAGDPTKWVPINDNGTTRYIPAW